MAKAETTFNGKQGVWRTIGGRRIFIATGQSLEDAMKESGKFNNLKSQKMNNKKYVDENGTEWTKEELKESWKKAKESGNTDKDFDSYVKQAVKEKRVEKIDDTTKYLDKAKENYTKPIKDDDNFNKQNGLKTTMANVESYKADYQKYKDQYEKYADLASKAQYGSDEYQKYSAKRTEAYKNMQEAKVNTLTEFNKTIPYDEMFDVAKKISGSKNAQFEEPTLVNRDGTSLYTQYRSNDIKADTGIFSSVLKSARLENFNSELYIDRQTGEPTYWGSLDLRYQHNGGGTNGMQLMQYKYNSKTGWDITDSAGYKYKNGKKITTVSGLTDYYMEYYGYSKETAKKMAQASLDDISRRSTDISY